MARADNPFVKKPPPKKVNPFKTETKKTNPFAKKVAKAKSPGKPSEPMVVNRSGASSQATWDADNQKHYPDQLAMFDKVKPGDEVSIKIHVKGFSPGSAFEDKEARGVFDGFVYADALLKQPNDVSYYVPLVCCRRVRVL